MPTPSPFDLDRLGGSWVLLLTFAGVGAVAGLVFWVGLLGWFLGVVSVVIRRGVRAGFLLWRGLLSWARWPVFLGLIAVILALGIATRQLFPPLSLGCAMALLLLGVITCTAYVFIDLERYEVARGYKAIHDPLRGQELASDLVRFGGQVGVPLLVGAAVGVVGGFALLNQGLYETVGEGWYRLAGAGEKRPDFADFLAYTLINLIGVVDLLHVANSYNYIHASYVQQAKWPASTLLTMFKSFFTLVLLQQIFASVRQGKLLSETIADFWSPHPPIQERARGALPQFGPGAVWPLLRSLRPVPALTAEQREYLPRIIADLGPAAVPALMRHLHDASENVRAVAVAALGRLHALDAVTEMVTLVHDPADWVRQALAEALGAVTGTSGKPVRRQLALRPVLRPSWGWLGWTLRLRRVARSPADPVGLSVSVLRSALADSSAAVRAQAARSLGLLGPAAAVAVPDLIPLLGGEDEAVSIAVVESLGKLGVATPEVVDALVGLLKGQGTTVRVAAAKALGAMKDKVATAVASLTPMLLDPDEAVRTAVAEAVGHIGVLEGEAIEEMARGLESKDTLVRAQTAEALGTIGAAAADAAPALAEALADTNDRVRAKAAEALGQMGEAAADAVPELVRALRDNDTWVSALAAEALGEIGGGNAAVSALIRALRHTNPQVRGNAAGALGKLGKEARTAAPALVKAACDAEEEVRAQAIAALGEVGDKDVEAGQALLSALADASPKVRGAAVEAIGKRDDLAGADDVLLRATQDVSDEVKAQAARALPSVVGPTPAALDALCKLLGSGSAAVQIEATQALGRLGQGAVPAGAELLRLTQSGESSVREQALRAMAIIQPPQAVEAFLAGLKDARPEARMVASAGLIKAAQGASQAVPALIEALRDPEAQVRANAAASLARLSELPSEAIVPLASCAPDADDGVRLNAALALRSASTAEAVVAFRQWLVDPTSKVRLLAAGSLLTINSADIEAAAVLVPLLEDPSPRVRRAAVERIESLGAGAAAYLEELRRRAGLETDPELSGLLDEVIERVETSSVQATPGKTGIQVFPGPRPAGSGLSALSEPRPSGSDDSPAP